jgi:hypothetical protein
MHQDTCSRDPKNPARKFEAALDEDWDFIEEG